jgi:putative YhbY family RNA-binding protein
MKSLTPAERRALRAKAHPLHPVVIVGHHGLTPAVLHEIDVNLLAHELIKVRVASDDRDERETLLARISDALDAAPVQHLGKVLTIWRPAPEEGTKERASPKPAPRNAATKKPASKKPPPKRTTTTAPDAAANARRRRGHA